MVKQKELKDCITMISPEMVSYLHGVHQRTVEETVRDGKLDPFSTDYLPPDVLSLKKHRYKILSENGTDMFSGMDKKILECYISSFPKAIRQREMTKTMTDVVDGLVDLLMHIGIWITHHEYVEDMHIAVHITARRKDWEGEETKLLLRAAEAVYNNSSSVSVVYPPVLRDLFGIRIILEQTTDKKVLLKIMKIIVAILTNPNSKEYKNFYNWVRTSNKLYGGSPIPKERLLRFLDYDFSMSYEKNYIENPKPNGYESWQATFTVEPTSPKAGGSMFELQGRTSEMEERLEYGLNAEGDLGHDAFKEELFKLRKEIFTIENYTGGLLYYNPRVGYDADGIGKSKQFSARTSSVHLVSEKNANTDF